MKKKQVYFMIALCISVLFFALFSIYMYHQKTILTSYYPTTESIVYDMDVKEIGIKKEWLKSYHLLSSLFLISSERIFMFECKEEYQDKVISKVHEYVDVLKSQFNNSKELETISNYQEYMEGDFYIFVISKKANTIMKDIQERIA